jgi:hypothetical protein
VTSPAADPVPDWQVGFTAEAAAQAAWVEGRTGLNLRERVTDTLSLGPQPHAYRRIRRRGHGWELAVRDWRARFRVAGREIEVVAITSGYKPAALAAGADAAHELHREFVATWPLPSA